jgi:quercetin dioxygenase-like cupin family protein
MLRSAKPGRGLWRFFAAAGVIAGATLLIPAQSDAGQCPAGEMVADGQKPGAMANKGATDKVLSSIDLGKEKIGLKGHQFRLRQLTIQPGGEVAWHNHAERPALIYVVSGSIVEYANTCAVPVVHNAGEVAMESIGLAHWWKNTAEKPAVLLSADIVSDPTDKNM